MNEVVRVTRKQVAPWLAATFPEYRGRKLRVHVAERVTFYDTNWSGGTRSEYRAVREDGRSTGRLAVPAPWANPVEGATVDLPQDTVLAEHTVFCGKDAGVCFYVHPARLRLLAADASGEA